MSPHVSAVVVLKTLSLVLGGLITYFAYKAYRRTGSDPLRALALGFGLVTAGALMAGVLDQVLAGPVGPVAPRDAALLVESLLTTAGFGVILYSLYAD
jgi:hypothetical protein